MGLLGARVVEVDRGVCVIKLSFRDELAQQQRYFLGAIDENAGGYGASSTSALALIRQYIYENNVAHRGAPGWLRP